MRFQLEDANKDSTSCGSARRILWRAAPCFDFEHGRFGSRPRTPHRRGDLAERFDRAPAGSRSFAPSRMLVTAEYTSRVAVLHQRVRCLLLRATPIISTARRCFSPISESLPNRIPLGPEAPRHRLVYDHDARRVEALFSPVKSCPATTGMPIVPKPIGSDDVVIRAQRMIGRGLLLSHDKDRMFRRTPAERHHRRQTRRFRLPAARRRDPSVDGKTVALLFRIPLRSQIERQRQHAFGCEAQVDRRQSL